MNTSICKSFYFLTVIVLSLDIGVVYSASVDGFPAIRGETTGLSNTYWPHGPFQIKTKRDMQYCGSRLFEAIRNLCKGNFAGMQRRSDPSMNIMQGGLYEDSYDAKDQRVPDLLATGDINPQYSSMNDIDNSENSLAEIDSIWSRNPKTLGLKALTEGTSHQRIRRSVIEECCKQPCSMRVMLKYCG